MTDFTDFDALDDLEFADNQDARCAIQFVLDCSGSMTMVPEGEATSPLESLNSALDILVSEIRNDPLSSRRVELSFIPYGSDVGDPTPFATIDSERFVLPELVDMGTTSSGAALMRALDNLEERKAKYKSEGISYYQPQIFWLTDGLSMDPEVLAEASERIKKLEGSRKLAFFPIGVVGADMDEMSTVGSRTAIKLSGLKFNELFQWISQSAASVSASQVGDRVALPSPAGWAEI